MPSFDTAFSILRDAETLEANIGLRHEFSKIVNSEAPGQWYWSGEVGFASVENTDDLAKINQLAFGIVITDENFRNSFVEIGRGKNELFPVKFRDRKIFRIHLEYLFTDTFVGFLETEVDFESSTGADSIRTKIGFEIPIGKIFN